LQKGLFQVKPFISGDTEDEGTFNVFTRVTNVTSEEDFKELLIGALRDNETVQRVEELYPSDPSFGS
jgi:hypothetical protein